MHYVLALLLSCYPAKNIAAMLHDGGFKPIEYSIQGEPYVLFRSRQGREVEVFLRGDRACLLAVNDV